MNELKISTHGGWVDGVNNVTITVYNEEGLANGTVELTNVPLAIVDDIRTNVTVTKFGSAYIVNSKAAGYVSTKTPHNVDSIQEAAEEIARLSFYAVTGRWLANAA